MHRLAPSAKKQRSTPSTSRSTSKPSKVRNSRKLSTQSTLKRSPQPSTANPAYISTRSIVTTPLNVSSTSLSSKSTQSASPLSTRLPVQSFSKRSLFIQTQSTPNPRSLKFVPGKDVLGEKDDGSPNTTFFDQSQRATARRQSSLAYSILLIEGVMNVMLGADFVTVTTTDDNQDWMIIKPMVYAAITDAYATDEPILKSIGELEPSRELPTLPGDEEAVALIKEIIDHRIRPTVMDDGGDVEFIQFDADRTVWLLMKGSCSGCPSSGATLKQGIQNMIMHYVPEVKSVDEWKDEVALISDDAFARLEAKLASKEEKH